MALATIYKNMRSLRFRWPLHAKIKLSLGCLLLAALISSTYPFFVNRVSAPTLLITAALAVIFFGLAWKSARAAYEEAESTQSSDWATLRWQLDDTQWQRYADLAARESFRQTVKRLAVTYGWIGLYALYDFFNDNSRTRNSFSDASYFVGLLLVMTGIFFVRSKLARRSMLKQPPRVWISHDRIVIGNKLLKIEETDRSTWQVHADAKGEPLLRLQTNLKSAPLLFAPVTSADAARLASAAQQVLVTS